MQAYKLKGTIDPSGHLVIHDPIAIPPGEVEIVVWLSAPVNHSAQAPKLEDSVTKPKREVQCDIPVLKAWLEQTEPAPPNFDADRAKWEYLKEKHNL
jgi:hypothetical protein